MMQPTIQQLRTDYKCSVIPVLLTKHPFGSLLPQVWDEADQKLKGVWKPYQSRHPNEEEFSKWLLARPPAFAIVTGQISARVCFDFDGAAGVALANKWGVTPHRRTGSGGFHLDTDHPGWYVPTLNGKAKQELGERWPGLDVKGDHGYAIAIGRNEIGAYEWLRDPAPDPMSVIPAEVWEFLAGYSNRKITASVSAPPIRRTEASNGHARVSSELLIERAVSDARSSGRNNAGFTLACQLRDNHYGEAETLGIMRVYQSRVGTVNMKGQREAYTDVEINATVREVFSKPAREPWAPLRNVVTPIQQSATATAEPTPVVDDSPTDEGDGSRKNDPPEPPTPQFHPKTGRLVSVVPTIAETLLYSNQFASNEGERLHVFRGGVYRDIGLEVIRQEGRKLMEQWGAAGQWKKGIADEVGEWILLKSPKLSSRPPLNRICLKNGIFNLDTRQLEPHSPTWLCPIQLPVIYDPAADCPAWDAFAKTAMPTDVYQAEVMFQLAALLMVPFTSAQRSLLLQGPRGTGKSRFLFALRSFLGAENTSSQSLHTLEENRFACPYLYGKLANICADLPTRDLETTSKFKAITGEDYIDAEYKHGNMFQFKPFARLLFSANQPPQSKDASDAFLDRWWIIPFTQRFQDAANQVSAETLDARLSAPGELSGVLNRALNWLPKVIKQHGLTQTPVMREAHDEFCAATDPFRVWLSEFICDDPESVAPCNEVLASYYSFRRQRGLPPVSKTAFGLELRKNKRGIDMKERTVSRNGKMSTPWCYVGIRLKGGNE